MNQRLERLVSILTKEGLDAILVEYAPNRRYMTGFTGSAGTVIITPDRAFLATDFRYYEQAQVQAPDYELYRITLSPLKAVAECLQSLGAKRVGYESHVVTVKGLEQYKAALPDVEWVATDGIVEGLRAVKDEQEIEAIKKAVAITDAAIEDVFTWIRPGMTELEVAWRIEVYQRTHGASALSFSTIVAAGPRSSLPHAVPTDRPMDVGDPVVIDMGCVVDGYCSDLTRSFIIGEATEEYAKVWNKVLEAQLACEKGIVAGMSGREADAIARDIIYSAGYEGQFGHGLGHCVGLEIHEEPRASMMHQGPINAGAALTVEPGIYIPGWGGIRLEDIIIVGEGESTVLTKAIKPMAIPVPSR